MNFKLLRMQIIIKNLSERINQFYLETFFEKYGEVSKAKIVYDRHTGESKGIGFVTMPNDEEASKAIEATNGTEWDEQILEVAEAEDRRNKLFKGW